MLLTSFSISTVLFSQTPIISSFDDYGWTVSGGIMYCNNEGGNQGGFFEFEDTPAG